MSYRSGTLLAHVLILFGLVALVMLPSMATATAPAVEDVFQYYAPRPGAMYVSPGTALTLRPAERWQPDQISAIRFEVTGSKTGVHSGRKVLTEGGNTIIFYPDQPFALAELVTVQLSVGSQRLRPYQFTIAAQRLTGADSNHAELPQLTAAHTTFTSTIPSRTNGYRTAPDDLPVFDVYAAPGMGNGYIFITYGKLTDWQYGHAYLLMLDNNGEPAYYKPLNEVLVALDFKKQPNGLLTYFDPSPLANHFVALDSSYQRVRTYQVGNGYVTDLHDLQIIPNGNALMMIDDYQIVDMSQYVAGGKQDAVVVGCILQEVDPNGNVVFEWRSWDHIAITETNQSLLPVDVDENGVIDPLRYIHCNAIERDRDGHWLLSSRHLDSITKINRQTGEVIWRLGGALNDFEFTNDGGFYFQHDARRQSSGNLTLYDNGSRRMGAISRGVEYQLDEVAMTATRVWQYRHTPDYFARAMGNMQRLPNGNSVIGWGWHSQPIVTEVTRDGTKVFELHDRSDFGSYRAFRFPWVGRPTWPPQLAADSMPAGVRLFFSWNGATEVTAYKILAGQSPTPQSVVATVDRTGFETTFDYEPPQSGLWYFQVIALDRNGVEMQRSNVVPAIPAAHQTYLSIIR